MITINQRIISPALGPILVFAILSFLLYYIQVSDVRMFILFVIFLQIMALFEIAGTGISDLFFHQDSWINSIITWVIIIDVLVNCGHWDLATKLAFILTGYTISTTYLTIKNVIPTTYLITFRKYM